jgi:preprotein translocase subunit SecG
VRKWWNWQTHHLEGVAPKGMRVQLPPSAPYIQMFHWRASWNRRGKASLGSEFLEGANKKHKRMTYIYGLIVFIHILVCFFIIIVVLLQSGQSGDISAAFGGQGSQTAFGPRGAASALSKATTWSAVVFMVTSIVLSVYATKRGGPASVLQGLKSQPVKTQPAPAPTTPPTQK